MRTDLENERHWKRRNARTEGRTAEEERGMRDAMREELEAVAGRGETRENARTIGGRNMASRFAWHATGYEGENPVWMAQELLKGKPSSRGLAVLRVAAEVTLRSVGRLVGIGLPPGQ